VLAFAHRGGALHPDLLGLENTLVAFEHAYDLGYRYLETDVHASSDGVLFAFHDDLLDRVTDRTGRLADLSAVEIERARIRGTHPVPRFSELVDAFPDVTFNVDLKSDDAVEPLAALLADHEVADRTIVGSFSPRRLSAFRHLTSGRVRTAAHPREVAAFVLCPTPVLATPLRLLPCVALQVPVRTVQKGRSFEVVTRRFVRNAHAAGKQVHVWTIDDPVEMERLIDLDVDGLMTDRTDLLKGVLLSRGLWTTN
jgi:glycerophosphoryl diester phosphodiesterase